MATSTRASASSLASIRPVGPPPAITTACWALATLDSSCISILRWVVSLRPATVRHDRGLAASPPLWHRLEVERGGGRTPSCLARYFLDLGAAQDGRL